MSVSEIRAYRLGLSNELFCNKPRHAAKIKEKAIVIRSVGRNIEGNVEGLQKARKCVAERGYNGTMSRTTRSKVAGMLAAWVQALKAEVGTTLLDNKQAARKLTFVTLTLPSVQRHTDNELKRTALGRFLQECKRQYSANVHFWRGETQKNGNLHFHVLFQVFMPWKELRAIWNGIMKDMGYIDAFAARQYEKYKHGFRHSREGLTPEQKKKEVAAYWEGVKNQWQNPNSTDIHALYKVNNAAAYICKYVAKDGENRKVEGRIWGCTDTLRDLKEPEVGVQDEFIRMCTELAAAGIVQKRCYDSCTIYTGNIHELLSNYAPELLAAVELYYSDISEMLTTFNKKI